MQPSVQLVVVAAVAVRVVLITMITTDNNIQVSNMPYALLKRQSTGYGVSQMVLRQLLKSVNELPSFNFRCPKSRFPVTQ